MFRALLIVPTLLVLFACGEAPSSADLRSEGGRRVEADFTKGMSLVEGELTITDYKLRVIQCDPAKPADPELQVREFSKAEVEGHNAWIAKSLQNVRVFPSEISVTHAGLTASLKPAVPSGTNACGLFEAYKVGSLQDYAPANVASGISARVQLEDGVGSGDNGDLLQVKFDVSVLWRTDLGSQNVSVGVASKEVSALIHGTAPTSYTLLASSIVNKSPKTSNACVFAATLKCDTLPVATNGKLKSCNGIDLSMTPWRLYETSGTAPVLQPQSSTKLSTASEIAADGVTVLFTFDCARGKSGVTSEVKKLKLALFNSESCDGNSNSSLECGRQEFSFALTLGYANP